jgi:hypothetical protein
MAPQLLQALDAAVKNDFQSLRNLYFHKLTACTIAVVVGVFIEEAEYFLSWTFVRRFVPLNILLPTHRFESWVRITAKTGWALIVIGVAGEGLYEARVSRADGWLQDFSNSLLTAAQRQAAQAMGEAGDARERAAVLEKQAADLSERIVEMGPRDLLLYGKRGIDFVKGLKPFRGQKVQVRNCFPETLFNAEVSALKKRLRAVLTDAGWDVFPVDAGYSGCTGTEVWVGISSDASKQSSDRARALLASLHALPMEGALHTFTETDERRQNPPLSDPDSIVIVLLQHSFSATSVPINAIPGVLP